MSFAAAFAGTIGVGTAGGSDLEDCSVYVNGQTNILTMGRQQIQLSKREVDFFAFMVMSPLFSPNGVTVGHLEKEFGDDAIAMVDGLRERLKKVSIANDGGDGGTYTFNEKGEYVHLPTFHEYTVTADMLFEKDGDVYRYRSDLAGLIDKTHEISEQDLDRLCLKTPASVFSLSF